MGFGIGSNIIFFLCIISFKHYLLFHSLVELFGVVAAYTAFVIIWKSKGSILNIYLRLLGHHIFSVASFDLLHTLTFGGIEELQELDLNPSMQFGVIARYIESISFLIAPLFLIQNKNNEMNNSIFVQNSRFPKKALIHEELYKSRDGYVRFCQLSAKTDCKSSQIRYNKK